jgi:hypothetical protein
VAVVVNTVKIVAFGSNGIEVTVLDGVAVPANTPALIIAGSDGTNARYIRTATDGTVRVDPTGTTTQPISASSLPLPTNAATETSLVAQSIVDNAGFSDAVTRIVPAGFILDETPGTALTENDAAAARIDSKRAIVFALEDESTRGRRLTITAANAAKVDGSAVTQPVSAASLPLPAGAATEVTLATRLADATFTARVNTLGQKTMANSTPVVLSSDHSQVPVTFTQTNAVTGVSSANLLLGGGTASTLQVLRSTPYTEPASAAQRSVGSSSANDASAGTGARTVVVKYFNGSGAGPFEETVTLNGTTPVNTIATDIRFIESIQVATVGSGGSNAGTITLYGSTGGTGGTVGTIGVGTVLAGVGDNTTLWAHHYVPANWEVEVATLTATIQSGGSGTTGKFFLRVAHPLVANSADVVFDGVMLLSGSFRREYQFKTQIEGFARIVAYAIPGVNNTEISVAFDWSEVPL